VLRSTAVQTAASLGGGTNVIVRIIYDGTENVPISSTNINSQTLTAGSVTVLPDSGVNFTLNLNTKLLTLNKGYRLQGFKIVSGDPDGTGAAITLAAAGTPLKDMLIDCTGLGSAGTAGVGSGDRCIEVTASSATVTLDNVDVLIGGNQDFTAGIRHVGTNTILRVINGSSVVATGSAPSGNQGVVGILENSTGGSVEIEGPNTEVNLSAISPPTVGTPTPNVAILLRSNSGPARKVINSEIKVREANPGQIGVCVGGNINVTVQGNTFTNSSSGNNSIAICKAAGIVSPTPPDLFTFNTFNGFSTSPPPTEEKRYVTSCSCPS
jgi:hypothetical protein